MNQHYQRGATMWTTLSVIFMIGFIVYIGAVVGNIFLDHKFISGSMQEVANQSNFKSMTKNEIVKTINKRLTIDNIRGLDKDVINVKRERSGNGRYIHVKYEKKSNLFANVNILVEFDEEIRTTK